MKNNQYSLASNTNYTNKNIEIISDVTIREYDMSEGGFSLIKEFNLLPDDVINDLQNNYTKQERTIKIGKLQLSNKKLAPNMINSFKEARYMFCENNDIVNNDILSIKKDALFIIKKSCKNLKFGNYIEFKLKNTYSSFCYINNIEFYYSNRTNKMDVKGLSNLEHPLLEDIKSIIRLLEFSKDHTIIFKKLQKLRYDYLSRNLDLEYYRELNSENSFKLQNQFSGFKLSMADLPYNMYDKIDISYNYINYIVPLIKIIL